MASLLSLDLSKPYLAYYSVPAAYLITTLPGVYRAIAAGKHFDSAQPRKVVENCAKDESIDKKTILRLQRAEAASANGFESLGMYAGGIAAAAAAGVPAATLNSLAGVYLASRAAYNVVYVFLQDNRRFAPVRSLVWNVGLGIIVALWVKAGNRATAAAAAIAAPVV